MLPPTDPQVEEIRRLADALRTAIRLSRVSHRHIERVLGMSTGYLTRILAGQVQLRVNHVLGVCHVIGLPPASFFAAVYPPTPPTNAAETRLVRGLAQLHPRPSQTPDAENLLNALRAFVEEIPSRAPEKK